MPAPVLVTKLYIPSARSGNIPRPRLVERLNNGLSRKLTLISAPAGFGKTTLLSEWAQTSQQPAAWLSLDEEDSDPPRFLTYLIAALQTVVDGVGAGLLAPLQSPQAPAVEPVLATLLNEIACIPDPCVLILDDFHEIDSQPVDQAVAFLLEHMPPQMRLVIATREDPQLPLARLRAQGQLTELRAADLRFSLDEAAGFLHQTMGLRLSVEEIAALETRTEGWIAGLQLAALAVQGAGSPAGEHGSASFIQSFTGSHRFVMDYLVEEVLMQQPAGIQTFLLRTSILDRLCGPLCDAVVQDPQLSAADALATLERANLFVVPLDNERRWYRYHHLFAELLRQRLQQVTDPSINLAPASEYHRRASQWFEDSGLQIEAFKHAAAAGDIDRAERLLRSSDLPLHLRPAVTTVLDWLAELPVSVLNERPFLWWQYGALLLVTGQTNGVEEKLQAAEDYLPNAPAGSIRNLTGQIAAARATLALTRYDPETMISQSQRALEYLDPANVRVRANALWTMGYAYVYQGERAAARRTLNETIAISQTTGNIFTFILAAIGLGVVQEGDLQLHQAVDTQRSVLQAAGDQRHQILHEAHLCLARVYYEWNDLDTAEQHAREALQLAHQYDRLIDRFVLCELFLARLRLARGDAAGAAAGLAEADQAVRRNNFIHRKADVASVQVLVHLRLGNLAAAAEIAETLHLPVSLARVALARGEPTAALRILSEWRSQVESKGLADERLRVMVLQAAALHNQGNHRLALDQLGEALALAEPAGCIRTFVDEGPPIAHLLTQAVSRRLMPDYSTRLLAAFASENHTSPGSLAASAAKPLVEPLSQRELEVLRFIAEGLSNQEISDRLVVALSTVKGHNLRIFSKLNVQRRTEAIARARELGYL